MGRTRRTWGSRGRRPSSKRFCGRFFRRDDAIRRDFIDGGWAWSADSATAGSLARSRSYAVRWVGRWRVSVSAGRSQAGGSRRPLVRQQDRADADEAGGADVGRTHHGGRRGGTGPDSAGSAGDRPEQATVLPGLIDAHTHMFNTRGPKTTTEGAMLIAVQNAQADLRAGFTAARDMSSHGNGYGDVEIRNAINEGRIDGPRYQVSTRGIVWGARRRIRRFPTTPGRGGGALRGRSARGRAGPDCAWRGLDQAVSGRRLLVQRDRSGPIRGDLSAAGAAGAD